MTKKKEREIRFEKPFTVRLRPKIRKGIQQIAQAKDVPEAQLVRDAIKEYLTRQTAETPVEA